MKTTTTCLFAAMSGLALAQEPAPPPMPPMPRVHAVPAIPGQPAEVTILPTFERGELGEPLRWNFVEGRAALHDVVRSGPVGFLGVNATILPRELSAHLSLPQDTGLMVEVVAKDSPAEKAGLQTNDVLAKFDDQILIDPRQLSVLVANKKEGDAVKVTYIRKGESHEASVVIGKREGAGIERATGKVEADVLLEHGGGAPLRTFVRRFEMPGGGELKIAGSASGTGAISSSGSATASAVPVTPPDDDVKKQLEEIRAMLEALQQKVK